MYTIIKKLIRRVVSAVSAAAIALTMVSATGVTASAATVVLPQPRLSVSNTFGNRLDINVDNAAYYSPNVRLLVYYGSRLVTYTVPRSNSVIALTHDGLNYFTENTSYTFTVKPIYVYYGKITATGPSASIRMRTDTDSYYSVPYGTRLYKLTSSGLAWRDNAPRDLYVTARLTTSTPCLCAGRPYRYFGAKCIQILSGEYRGWFASLQYARRMTAVNAKRMIVADYGRSMDGGYYCWGGSSYRYTDCSGLTMQCYDQIGVDLGHSVYWQSREGYPVASVGSMKPGDLIIMNYGSHVAMYVGSGQMVHAMNYSDGIKVQSISYLQYYHVDSIRRLIV